MVLSTPHHAVREDWLALAREEVLAPDQPILDAHHHLWDRPEGRYIANDFQQDAQDGHDIRASIYVQCRTGYRSDGPVEFQPLGEVETILDWSANRPAHPVGIVGFADLQLGDAVRPVLEELVAAGRGKLRGIRNTTAYHPDPAVRSNPRPAPDGLLRSDAFHAGAAAVAESGLVLDVWAYQTQLDEVQTLALAVPDLTIVVDHCGGPLGVGPFRRDDPDSFRSWRDGLARVAALPNTRIKIGGFGLSVIGYDYAALPAPPSSQDLVADWRAHVDTCLDLFTPERAMFESNFPVDKGQFGYRTLWNAFKRLAEPLGCDERNALFWHSAACCYGIDAALFSTDNRRTLS
ncbi:amidohydrolase [Paracoccus sp. SCSIO 75233]|uniref:amidohydrolase family protein n=1 Tax=Paracoccus sp. SCSIO 75233 TaxID=3017782 RepID=UPI0022F09D81|nr:amidohydrolase family protein [Paracoccus sp. SCSIO 75233]WBU53978.1 amidohydrolase family protein [Paracoccus sp. SCSIO 75233]